MRIERNGFTYDTEQSQKIIERTVTCDAGFRYTEALYRGQRTGKLFKIFKSFSRQFCFSPSIAFGPYREKVIFCEMTENNARAMISDWGFNSRDYGFEERLA